MTRNPLAIQIENDVIKNIFISSTIGANGHTMRHDNLSDIDSINRIVTHETTYSSSFQSEIEMNKYINDVVLYNADTIATWLDGAKQFEKQSFFASFSDKNEINYVGSGYSLDRETNIVREYKTDTVVVVLQQNANNKYGFTILTAYPAINNKAKHLTPTNRDLTPIIQQTQTYQKASPVKKTFLEYQANPEHKTRATYSVSRFARANDTITLYRPMKNKNREVHVSIKENSLTACIVNKNTNQKCHTSLTKLQGTGSLDVNLLDEDLYNAFAMHAPKTAMLAKELYATVKNHKKSATITKATKPTNLKPNSRIEIIESNSSDTDDYDY